MPQDDVELEITNVAHGGVFVARFDGRVVFVPDTMPGERIRARITDTTHDRFWRAETLSVIDAAPERQAHLWPAASVEKPPSKRAGGAEFGHIRLDHQRELKRRVIVDALARMAKIDRDVTVEPAGAAVAGVEPESPDGSGWRTRVRLQVAPDGAFGPFASRSHHVVEVDDLPLATERVAESAPFGQRFAGAESIDVVATTGGSAHVLVNDAPVKRGRRTIRPRHRPMLVRERVGDREFQLDARGFWQVHRLAAATLTEAVQSAVDEALFDPRAANLDLYGGVGLLAAAIGDRFGSTVRITSVEGDETATDHAAENLAEWIGANAVTERVERFVTGLAAEASPAERSRFRAATVILDPPRSGAGRAVVDAIAELSPAQVVYVACDPIALARDLATFAGHGYELGSLRAFDLFPNTHHVEAVAMLSR
ncbi:class I SAM-dependent RNA methyltransferase [Diaminobutyricibacter tongyongensis]|uniref:Class I SAM-dependent RNA methyltransferase n=1 Tax=Leifsonia tongyongensis TaxID=1268043 RepID=A0A6L9XZZ5_9MICO|nr:class I SAM-dependent RNA methyltransferase [Diaminobutyricibacter tongyongensis]NEN06983.1 class I SAM-dependent RNA methyltransferase [Diaminobutyricibacter tongyongensis]